MKDWKNNSFTYNEGGEMNISMNPSKENKSCIDSNKKEKKSIFEKYFEFLNNDMNPNKEIEKTNNDISNNSSHSNEIDCNGTNESTFYEIKSSREFIKGSLLNFGSYSENVVSSKMSFYSIYEYTDDNEDIDCKIEDNEQEHTTILMKNKSYLSLPNKEILPEYKDNNDYMHIYDTDHIYSDEKSDHNVSDDNINGDKPNEESITKEMGNPQKMVHNNVEEKKKYKWLQKKLLKKKFNLICRHKIKNEISKFQYLGIISILNKKYAYIVVNKKIVFKNKTNNKNESFFKRKTISKNIIPNKYSLFCKFSKKKAYNVLKTYKINRQYFFTYLHLSMLQKYYKKKIVTYKGVKKTILNKSDSVIISKNEQQNEIDIYNNNSDILCTSHPPIQNESNISEKTSILENTIRKITNEKYDDKNSPKKLMKNNNKGRKKKTTKKNYNVASGKANIYFEGTKKFSDNENINDSSKQETNNKKKRKNKKKKRKKNKQNQNSNNKQMTAFYIFDNKEKCNHEMSINSNDLKYYINYYQEEKTINNNSKYSYFSQQIIIPPSKDENATDYKKNIYNSEKANSNISLNMIKINKSHISCDGYPTSDEDMDIFINNDMSDSKNGDYKVKNNNQDNNFIGIINVKNSQYADIEQLSKTIDKNIINKYSDSKYNIDEYTSGSYEHYNKYNLETNKKSNLVIYSEIYKNNDAYKENCNFGKSFENILKEENENSNLIHQINNESYQSLYNYKKTKYRKIVNSEEDIENNLENEIKRTIEELFKAFPEQFFLNDLYEEQPQKTTIQSENIIIRKNDQDNQIMYKNYENIEITTTIENHSMGYVQNEMSTESQRFVKFIEKDKQHIIRKTKIQGKVSRKKFDGLTKKNTQIMGKKIQKDNKQKFHMKGKFFLNAKTWKNNKRNKYPSNCEEIKESYKNENDDTKKIEENPININNEKLFVNKMSQSEDSQKNEDMETKGILLSSTQNFPNLNNQVPIQKESGVMHDINMDECKKKHEDIVEKLPRTLVGGQNVDSVIYSNGVDANNDEQVDKDNTNDNKIYNYHHMITQMNENNMSCSNSEETIDQYSDACNIDEIHQGLGQENKINTLEKKCQIGEEKTEKTKTIRFYDHIEVCEVEKLGKNTASEESAIVKKLKKKKKKKKKSKDLQIYNISVFDKYIVPLIMYMNEKKQKNVHHNHILAKLIEYYIACILKFGKLHQYITQIYDNQHFINNLYIMNKKLIWEFYLKVIVIMKKKELALNIKIKNSISLIVDYKMKAIQIEKENLQICRTVKINKQIYQQNIAQKIDKSNSAANETPEVDNTSKTCHKSIPPKESENINLSPNSNQNNIKQSLKKNVIDYSKAGSNSTTKFVSYNNKIKKETTKKYISINLMDANKISNKQNQHAINMNCETNGNLFDVKNSMNNHIKTYNTSQNHNIYDYTCIGNINILRTPLYIHDSCNANINILNTYDMNRIDLQNMKFKKNMLMNNNKTMIQHCQSNEGTYNPPKKNIIKVNASKLVYPHANKPYNIEMRQCEQLNKNTKNVDKKNYLNRKDAKNYKNKINNTYEKRDGYIDTKLCSNVKNKTLTFDRKLAEAKIKNDLPVSTNTTKINKIIPKISFFKRVFFPCSFFNNVINDTKKIKYNKNCENKKIQNKMNVKNIYTRGTTINMNKYNLKVKKIVFHKKRKISKINKIIQQTNKYLEIFNSQSLSLFNSLCNNNYFNCLPLKNKNIESFHISFLDSLPNHHKSRVSYIQNTENMCIYKDF
ncbi:conserved Plasmodium protein, unknown function [Plasmodium berghei]|uniref:Uncharacterized protein n=3 Tax=Plasmodium berghei TaxID=5821 RepID=A0A509AKJ0_PLABA|nr:conserved Plasmodium protein, unknown function [Plasmodium berghei ANKA]CXI50171.1 conserved Plasmodium protein, unknown function [Plasmodium berghei]SCM15961.1 conserved Plasmodium protein, unknown function [Plasmodium berghei]SCM17757.1 conserved Plasmodium protein, unknown function [Plasmodium berghei]VUC56084.1 conserved Plasmodium protein, unknown function [Plasmodium berghei ANKA]|eukprot:XP_034421886.1 conserved Plasmodium protein, unknown function [Plasmodium berghei ANKA]